MLELGIGLVMLVLALGVWAYTHLNSTDRTLDRPKPAWLAMPKMMAQMGDGRMLNLKVNLQLANDQAVDALKPHVPAFEALIQETGLRITKDDIQEAGRLKQFSQDIRTSLNGYLEDQAMSARVKGVAFEELMLMP